MPCLYNGNEYIFFCVFYVNEIGMLLAKIGGPVYRIGVGGGAASSVEVQGDNSSELDFNAVQRGDAEMENKLNRVVRACVELGDKNPILAIHDQVLLKILKILSKFFKKILYEFS